MNQSDSRGSIGQSAECGENLTPGLDGDDVTKRPQITGRVDKRLRITATLILDEFSWARNDMTAQEWMLNEIVLGDDLRVFSPEIGDEIGVLIVHSAEDSDWSRDA